MPDSRKIVYTDNTKTVVDRAATIAARQTDNFKPVQQLRDNLETAFKNTSTNANLSTYATEKEGALKALANAKGRAAYQGDL
jgi:hypothetical protein